MERGVAINLRAQPDAVWALLTDTALFPEWNSTVQRIEGTVALGAKIAVRVHAAPTRSFRLEVGAFAPAKRMVWQHGAAPMFQACARTRSPRATTARRTSRWSRPPRG